MKKILGLLCVLLSGCAATDSQQKTAETSNVVFKNGSQKKDFDSGYFVLLEKSSQGWGVSSFGDQRPAITDLSSQEVLHISHDYRYIQPDFRAFEYEGKVFVCNTGFMDCSKPLIFLIETYDCSYPADIA